MTEAQALAAVQEARLAIKSSRSFVRDLNTKLARAEAGLEFLQALHAQPKEAQRNGEGEDHEGAAHDRGSELCAA